MLFVQQKHICTLYPLEKLPSLQFFYIDLMHSGKSQYSPIYPDRVCYMHGISCHPRNNNTEVICQHTFCVTLTIYIKVPTFNRFLHPHIPYILILTQRKKALEKHCGKW